MKESGRIKQLRVIRKSKKNAGGALNAPPAFFIWKKIGIICFRFQVHSPDIINLNKNIKKLEEIILYSVLANASVIEGLRSLKQELQDSL